MEKVVIMGSGCAGYTAAFYTAWANLKPLILTGKHPGGLLTTTSVVENYPGFPEGVDGYELMVRMQKQAERFGARVKFGMVEGVDLAQEPGGATAEKEKSEPVKKYAVPLVGSSDIDRNKLKELAQQKGVATAYDRPPSDLPSIIYFVAFPGVEAAIQSFRRDGVAAEGTGIR